MLIIVAIIVVMTYFVIIPLLLLRIMTTINQATFIALLYASLEDLINIQTGQLDLAKYLSNYIQRCINDEFSDDDIEADKSNEIKRRRTRKGRPDYEGTTWYKEYVIDADGKYNDVNSRFGKLYRQRFAYPLACYQDPYGPKDPMGPRV